MVNKPRLDREQLIVPEHPWENQMLGAYTSVVQEGDRIHLWYEARAQQGDWSCAYAYSDDGGASFTKPSLGVIEFNGSTDNNLVLTGGLGYHVFPLLGPDATEDRRYGALRHVDGGGQSWVDHTNRGYVSPDGLHWTEIGSAPFLYDGGTQTGDSQNVTFWDTRLEKYVVYPRHWSPSMGRAVGRAEGQTFKVGEGGFPYEESPIVLQRDAEDLGKQFYTSAAVQYPYAADAYFAFPAMLNGGSGPVDIQFAASRDGIAWLRPDRTPVIHEGFDQQGNTVPYEEGSLYAGYGFTHEGDEISLYYTTLACRHDWPPPNTGIITRAIYRLDGFMSVDAGSEVGEFTTPAILFEGDYLRINFDGTGGGWAAVEFIDEQATPIPGFTFAETDLLSGDSVAMPVTFGGSADLSSLRGESIRLHLIMYDAKLYAFQVGILPEPPGDANGDGKVTDADAAILATNWQSTEATWEMGDFNADGKVTDADAAILATHWQEGVAEAAGSVPEPCAWVLLGSGLAALLASRADRKRRLLLLARHSTGLQARTGLLVVALLVAVVAPCFAAEPLNIGTAKQVFIDGRFINNPQGVELVVNKPRLDREQLIVPEHPWENQMLGAYTSVIQEGDRIHLWYEARSTNGAWSLAYAYSTDGGATFIKPELGVIGFSGSTANNLVLDNSLGAHVFPMGPGSPKSEKYGLFIHIRANAANAGSRGDFNSAFVSPDGIRWTSNGDVPFWKRGGDLHLDTQNVIFWDTWLKRYVAFPRLFNGKIGRAVGRSESDTFGNFSKPTRVLVRDAEDKGVQFYTSAAVQYPFAADAYFAFPAMLNGGSGPVDIQFAASRDGIKWIRPDRRPIIHSGFDRSGNEIPYEKGSLYAGYGFTRKGNEISLYYTTLACRHVIPPPNSGIITRAIYRLDGFMSVDAGKQIGEFTTPAINFSASDGGWVEVEILDAQGKLLPGYTTTKADRISGDVVAKIVTWGDRRDVSPLQGRPVQLHFTMCGAKLYAFQFAGP